MSTLVTVTETDEPSCKPYRRPQKIFEGRTKFRERTVGSGGGTPSGNEKQHNFIGVP